MPERIKLGVNIDHVATLRQARYRENPRDCGQMVEPDPVAWALAAERAGADGITAHLREDRRHMVDSDIHRLRASIQTRLNLEMACTDEMLRFAIGLKPDHVCLVPENRAEVTTEGGLDVKGQRARVGEIVKALSGVGIITSLFIDPDPAQIETAALLASPCIELHTGAYANACYTPDRRNQLEKLRQGATMAHDLGLTVNAGHGINYVNIAEVREIPWLHELNIGHSIIARSLSTGVHEAVQRMKALIYGQP